MTAIEDEDIELLRLNVAEKLGWSGVEYSRDGVLVGLQSGKKRLCAVPSYARDIRAAWEIVELLSRLQIRISIMNKPLHAYVRDYLVEIGEKDAILGKACYHSAPLAICLAYLEVPEAKLHTAEGGQTTYTSGDFIEKPSS